MFCFHWTVNNMSIKQDDTISKVLRERRHKTTSQPYHVFKIWRYTDK